MSWRQRGSCADATAYLISIIGRAEEVDAGRAADQQCAKPFHSRVFWSAAHRRPANRTDDKLSLVGASSNKMTASPLAQRSRGIRQIAPPRPDSRYPGNVASCFSPADWGFTSTFLPGSAYTEPRFQRYHPGLPRIRISSCWVYRHRAGSGYTNSKS